MILPGAWFDESNHGKCEFALPYRRSKGCSNIRTQTSETIPPDDIAEWRHSSEGRLTFVVFTMRYMRHTSVSR